MKTYLIGYDLMKSGQDYVGLYDEIKAASNGYWWHNLDSTWIIRSNLNSTQIRDILLSHIDNNDKLVVLLLEGSGAWYGLSESGSQWLKNNL